MTKKSVLTAVMNGINVKKFLFFVLNADVDIMGERTMTDKEEKKDIVSIERQHLWKHFADGYESLEHDIEDFFGGKEEIKKEGVKKEFHTFKELMVMGVDKIHKEILLEDAEIKALEKKRKAEETTAEKVREKTDKVKAKVDTAKKSNFWD